MSERQQSQRETASADSGISLLPNFDAQTGRVGIVCPIGFFFLPQPTTPSTEPRVFPLLCEGCRGYN